MAKEKKFVQAITSRDEDFAQWYTDVVREAKLCDYSSVKGCLNYLPNGYAIWEKIQADLDKRWYHTEKIPSSWKPAACRLGNRPHRRRLDHRSVPDVKIKTACR